MTATSRFVLSSQKDSIARTILAMGLSHSDFDWSFAPTPDLLVSRLTFVRSPGFFFIFDYDRSAEKAIFSPGETSSLGGDYPGSWEGQFRCVQKWLGYLVRELDAKDPWAGLSSAADWGRLVQADRPDLPFSDREIAALRQALNDFREDVSGRLNLTASQLADLDTRLNTLAQEAAKQARQTWFTFALGTFLQIILALPEAQNHVRELLSTFTGLIHSALAALNSLSSRSPR